MIPDAPKPTISNPGVVDDNAKATPPTAITQMKILEPEMIALQHCLKDTIIKTGQMYSFYADTRRLGIEKHAPKPPQSLTTALGRDIERYDQLCDSIEAHLLRAINVLKRDLLREEKRIKAEERRKYCDTLMLPPSLPMTSEIKLETGQPPTDGISTYPKDSPIQNSIPGRRASVISISSLHRPQFPLKLDLSSTSLRITEEEASMFTKKGLASPVTLAPKSTRLSPNEFPPDFMAAFTNSSVPSDAAPEPPTIDLTLPNSLHVPQEQDSSTMNNGVGDSSDKPIELDLDIEMANMTDLFGDQDTEDSNMNIHDGLFSPVLNEGESEQPQAGNFGNFTANPDLVSQLGAAEPTILQSSVPSPGSLLAQFSSSRMMEHKPSLSDNAAIPSVTETFDINAIDLSNLPTGFFSNTQDSGVNFQMDMEAFLTLGAGGKEKDEGGSNQSVT